MGPFNNIQFHPVMHLPDPCPVLDLSTPEGIAEAQKGTHGIGRYLERRPLIYTAEQYEGNRNIHMGIDLQAPSGDPVFSFYEAVVWGVKDNNLPQDYGPTVVLKHNIEGKDLYSLYGHLSRSCLTDLKKGQKLKSGDKVGVLGTPQENGGWPPHLHFQLCLEEPEDVDFPGVVDESDLEKSKIKFPDPRWVLGPIYK